MDARVALEELLGSAAALETMGFSRKYPHHKVGDFYSKGVDRGYIDWILRECAKSPAGSNSTNFSKVGAFFDAAIKLEKQISEEERKEAVRQHELRLERIEQEKKRRLEEARLLKIHRKSTANGQLELLTFDILMIVCRFGSMGNALRMPCVSQTLRTQAGTLLQRMPTLTELAFYVPPPVAVDPKKAAKMEKEIKFSKYCRLRILRDLFMVDSSVPLLTATRDEFESLAMRSVHHISKFKALKGELKLAFEELSMHNVNAKSMLDRASMDGSGTELDSGGNLGSCSALTTAVNKMVGARKRIKNILLELSTMNKKYDLKAQIPTGNYTTEMRKRKVVAFLEGKPTCL